MLPTSLKNYRRRNKIHKYRIHGSYVNRAHHLVAHTLVVLNPLPAGFSGEQMDGRTDGQTGVINGPMAF